MQVIFEREKKTEARNQRPVGILFLSLNILDFYVNIIKGSEILRASFSSPCTDANDSRSKIVSFCGKLMLGKEVLE